MTFLQFSDCEEALKILLGGLPSSLSSFSSFSASKTFEEVLDVELGRSSSSVISVIWTLVVSFPEPLEEDDAMLPGLFSSLSVTGVTAVVSQFFTGLGQDMHWLFTDDVLLSGLAALREAVEQDSPWLQQQLIVQYSTLASPSSTVSA